MATERSIKQRLEELTGRFRTASFDDVVELHGLVGGAVQSVLATRFAGSLGAADLEDAMAIAIERLFESRDTYDRTKGPLQAWYYVLARNAAIDLLRKRAVETPVDAASWAERPAWAAKSEDQQSDQLRWLRDTLPRLSETDQRIVLERGNDKALAEELGLSEEAVRKRRHRAIATLRLWSKEWDGE